MQSAEILLLTATDMCSICNLADFAWIESWIEVIRWDWNGLDEAIAVLHLLLNEVFTVPNSKNQQLCKSDVGLSLIWGFQWLYVDKRVWILSSFVYFGLALEG